MFQKENDYSKATNPRIRISRTTMHRLNGKDTACGLGVNPSTQIEAGRTLATMSKKRGGVEARSLLLGAKSGGGAGKPVTDSMVNKQAAKEGQAPHLAHKGVYKAAKGGKIGC